MRIGRGGAKGEIPESFKTTMPQMVRAYTDGLSNTAMVGEMYRSKTTIVRGNQKCQGTPGDTAGYCNTLSAQYYQWPDFARCGVWALEANFGCMLSSLRGPNDKRPDQFYSGLGAATVYGSTGNYLNEDSNALPISSGHAGGAFAVWGDGSVHFVGDNVSIPVWRATTTYSGAGALGEVNTVYSEL